MVQKQCQNGFVHRGMTFLTFWQSSTPSLLPTLGSYNAGAGHFFPKGERKIRFLAGCPCTLGSYNARRAIFIPKVSEKYAFSRAAHRP